MNFARLFVFKGLTAFLFRAFAACALSTQKRVRRTAKQAFEAAI